MLLLGVLYRGSYRSADVLLNLLNKLGKRDEMQGLLSILSLFCNNFNKFNDTGVHYIKIKKSHFWRENVMILTSFIRYYGRHYISLQNMLITSGLSLL